MITCQNIVKRSIIKDNWPLLISIIILLAIASALLILSLGKNGGHIVYALDDPYIHMAMAKNFAEHGVWGVTKYGFTSSSSSPLYTLLLSALYFIFGVNEITPLILNIFFAIILITVVYIILKRYKIESFYNLIVLVSIIIFTPLPTLVFVGMEHIIQTLLVILFVYFSAKVIASYDENQKKWFKSYDIILLILAPFVTAIRYEGLVLLAVICVLIFIYRKFLYSIILGLIGTLPVIIYGLISISNGWYFLPNSIILKERVNILPYFITHHQIQLIPVEIQFLELLCAYIIFIGLYYFLNHNILKKRIKKEILIMNVILISIGTINFLFAGVGWFYRYDAYLVALGIFIIALSLSEITEFTFSIGKINKKNITKYLTIVLSLILIFTLVSDPLESRGFESLKETPQATNDRYLGHIHPAQFVAKYYNNSTIAVNDLGAMSFYTDARILDIYGLGSKEPVYYLEETGKYNKSEVDSWTKQHSAEIAILQPEWIVITPRIPDSWQMVGQWNTPQNVAFGDTTIGIYAVKSSKKAELIKNLREFSSAIPEEIKQSGEYTQ